jgi:hypothetical protein
MKLVPMYKRRKLPPSFCDNHKEFEATAAPEYYQSRPGNNVHLSRYVMSFIHSGKLSHISVECWCGTHGYIEPPDKKQKGKFFDVSPDDGKICEKCLMARFKYQQKHPA